MRIEFGAKEREYSSYSNSVQRLQALDFFLVFGDVGGDGGGGDGSGDGGLKFWRHAAGWRHEKINLNY